MMSTWYSIDGVVCMVLYTGCLISGDVCAMHGVLLTMNNSLYRMVDAYIMWCAFFERTVKWFCICLVVWWPGGTAGFNTCDVLYKCIYLVSFLGQPLERSPSIDPQVFHHFKEARDFSSTIRAPGFVPYINTYVLPQRLGSGS